MIKKMKNVDIVNAANGLQTFVNKEMVVPTTLSVAISANIKNLIRELEPYEEERQRLLKDNPQDLGDRFKELCEIEVDVNLRTISADIFEHDLLKDNLTVKDRMSLEFMIEDVAPESQSE